MRTQNSSVIIAALLISRVASAPFMSEGDQMSSSLESRGWGRPFEYFTNLFGKSKSGDNVLNMGQSGKPSEERLDTFVKQKSSLDAEKLSPQTLDTDKLAHSASSADDLGQLSKSDSVLDADKIKPKSVKTGHWSRNRSEYRLSGIVVAAGTTLLLVSAPWKACGAKAETQAQSFLDKIDQCDKDVDEGRTITRPVYGKVSLSGYCKDRFMANVKAYQPKHEQCKPL